MPCGLGLSQKMNQIGQGRTGNPVCAPAVHYKFTRCNTGRLTAKAFVVLSCLLPATLVHAQQKLPEKPRLLEAEQQQRNAQDALIHHYSQRAGQRLNMFGESFYNQPSSLSQTTQTNTAPLGQINDRYRLGPGDQLVIRLRGSTNRTNRAMIDASGQVALDDLLPVMAAGETLGTFKRELEAEVSRRFLDTEVFVGVDQLRQIMVSVTGAVQNPGPLKLNSLATPLDALRAAGGLDPLGSLRQIVWHQADKPGNSQRLDLYGYLLGDDPGLAQCTLRNGDQLHVPPLGPTLAIAGDVKRPGIFELTADGGGVGPSMMTRLSGGPLYPGAHQVVLSRLDGTDDDAMPYQVDGDHLGAADRLEFEHVPDALRLVLPRATADRS